MNSKVCGPLESYNWSKPSWWSYSGGRPAEICDLLLTAVRQNFLIFKFLAIKLTSYTVSYSHRTLLLVFITPFKCARRLAWPSCYGTWPNFFWILRQWKPVLHLQYVWCLSVKTMQTKACPPSPVLRRLCILVFNWYRSFPRPGCLTLVYVSPSLSSLQLFKFKKSRLTIYTLFSCSRCLVFFVNCHVSDSAVALIDDGCIVLGGSQAPPDVDFWPGRHD